jgi:major membrane immunogen (membrane-anchored lipoprotein)
MANADVKFGLRPVRYMSGAPYNGACNRYFVPASDGTALYIGGLVKLVNGGDANGVPAVTGNCASTDVFRGVVVGVEPVTADSLRYRAASTARYVFVADDPELVFACQEDSDGGALAATDIGKYAALVGMTSGSTVTAMSGIEIDSSDANATISTRAVQIIGLAQRADNEIGAKAEWLVRLPRHEFA